MPPLIGCQESDPETIVPFFCPGAEGAGGGSAVGGETEALRRFVATVNGSEVARRLPPAVLASARAAVARPTLPAELGTLILNGR